MRSEERVIRLFASPRETPEVLRAAQPFLTRGLCWVRLVARAKKEGVAAFLYHRLKGSPLEHFFPADVFADLKNTYYCYSARNVMLQEEVRPLLDSLSRRGLRHAVLKGVFLCFEVYPDPALRPITDVDLLVEKKDLARVHDILYSLGFREEPGVGLRSSGSLNSRIYHKGDRGYSLHLHWHLVNSTWPLDDRAAAIDMERIWRLARKAPLGGLETFTLAPEHLLIYLAYHCFQHYACRLILFADIAAVLSRYEDLIDWDLLKKEAGAFQMSYIVYHCLFLTSRLLGVEIPNLDSIKPEKTNLLQKALCPFLKTGLRNYLLYYFVFLSLEEGFKKKTRFMYKTLVRKGPGLNVLRKIATAT